VVNYEWKENVGKAGEEEFRRRERS